MSRIPHNTPLKAYDHVSNMLKEATGGDSVISRADAKELVKDLEKQGKGAEATAARNLFRMIDKMDSGSGNRVTEYDLNATRGFVEEKMLRNRDTNSNGYSKAEIADMSPTARSLVEIGQILEMDAARGRVSHSVPEKGMLHIAELMLEAGGSDGRVSRQDIEDLSYQLYASGRASEKLGVEKFFGFIDARDADSGSVVTKADIESAVEYASKEMLKDYDTDNNGYEKSEIAAMSSSAKAFMLIGQMLEAGLIDGGANGVSATESATESATDPSGLTGTALLSALENAATLPGGHVVTFWHWSESDYPINHIEFDEEILNGAGMLEAAKNHGGFDYESFFESTLDDGHELAAEARYEGASARNFFFDMGTPDDWDEPSDVQEKATYRKMHDVIKNNLTDVKVYVMGEAADDGSLADSRGLYAYFVVGKTADGKTAGYEFGSVET